MIGRGRGGLGYGDTMKAARKALKEIIKLLNDYDKEAKIIHISVLMEGGNSLTVHGGRVRKLINGEEIKE